MTVLLVFLLLLALVLGGSYYAYRVAFYSPRKGREEEPALDGDAYRPYREEILTLYRKLQNTPCEFVTIQSKDGLTLFGRYYQVRKGAPLDICFHGYRSQAFLDFAGGSSLSFELGHNLLLVDQRAHGRSEGRTITFGVQERWDAICWVKYARHRFGPRTEISLYGVSMGAATVLMASGLFQPDVIRRIIADCPYSAALDIILHVGKTNPLPQWLIRPFVILGARIFGGFNLLEGEAAAAVAWSTVPILILHGENDSFVPAAMSDLFHANPKLVRRETFPGADHALSFLSDPQRYRQVILDFIKET